MAYTVSLPFDRTMWRDDIAGSAAHVRGLARVGLLTDIERDAMLDALDQRRRRDGRRTRSCSSRATRTSTPPSSGGSPRSPGRPAASCTPLAAATTRWPPTCGCGASANSLDGGPLDPRPPGGAAAARRGGRRRLPARLHAPAARPAGAAGAPPARPRLGVRTRRRPPARHASSASTCRRSAPARWPARRCRSTRSATPPTSASPACSTTASTRSAIATSSPRRCSTSR